MTNWSWITGVCWISMYTMNDVSDIRHGSTPMMLSSVHQSGSLWPEWGWRQARMSDRIRTDLEKSWKISFLKKSWKTQGILKFGKLSENYHGISQNNHGIPNKYPWIILFAEYYSLKIKMNYLTLYVYVIRHWHSKWGISSVIPSYA